MINNHTISVIITNYKRLKYIDRVCRAWLKQPVEEVILCDCSNKAKNYVKKITDKRFSVISFSKDYGTKTDYAIARLTKGDYIILADDDVLVKEGFTKDLHDCQKRRKGIVGVIGRTFYGSHYRNDTTYYRSSKIDEPKRVGFVGVIYYSPRKYFGFDCREMHNNCDDLWWQMKVYPKIPKWVVPTKNYEDLPCATGNTSMFHDKSLRKPRYDFYKKWYLENKEEYDSLWGKKHS